MFTFPLLAILAHIGGSYQDEIQPTAKMIHADEGGFVTLTCKYSGSPYNIHWYRQYTRSAPKFLLLTTVSAKPSVVPATPPYPRLSVKLKQESTSVDLKISSAEVTDSALYYCALEPTVTGNKETFNSIFLQVGEVADKQKNAEGCSKTEPPPPTFIVGGFPCHHPSFCPKECCFPLYWNAVQTLPGCHALVVADMMDLILENVFVNPTPYTNALLAIPVPEDLSAQYKKPDKEDVIASFVSRFKRGAV
ncbi:hypothetical protein UPYG_G00289690 [Umbra pygmaea]|uniref:Ig-like domain-containing protein n=1 Tax=Umbra pygmaea TaxID=75934 RepID=A0ABD0W5G1_UMBPY